MATYYTRLLLCAATLQFAFTTKSLHAQQLLDGNYVITLADGGKALDADAPDINNNDCKVHLWDNNGGVTQVWTVRRLNASSY